MPTLVGNRSSCGCTRDAQWTHLRVRGKGVRKRDGTKGDLLVTVEVLVPQALNDQAREALNSYAGRLARPIRGRNSSPLDEVERVSISELPQRIDHDAPVFVISVALALDASADVADLRPMGLVSPRRTAKRAGATRPATSRGSG